MAEVTGGVNPSNPAGNAITSDEFGNASNPGGSKWTDGKHSQIRKIIANAKDGVLTGFQLHYVDDAKVTHGDAHGSTQREGDEHKEFDLKYPSEVLEKITGYYGEHDHIVKIKSLIFKTNTREFPAVGLAEPADEKFEIEGSNIIGLFGNADAAYVYSLGAFSYKKA